MLEQSGILENVEIEVKNNQIVITAATKARTGWSEAFAQMVINGEEEPVLNVANPWDEAEWEW